MSDKKNKKAHRGDGKNRAQAKSYGELVQELDGQSKLTSELNQEVTTLSGKLKAAEERLAVVEEISESDLKLSGLKLDLWIGGPVLEINWALLTCLALVVFALVVGAAGWHREAALCLCATAFTFYYAPRWADAEAARAEMRKVGRPTMFTWLWETRPGRRHLVFVDVLNERHEDLRHDVNKLQNLVHKDAVYAKVRVENVEDGDVDYWIVSLELLAQLLAPKYHLPTDSLDVKYERIMRDASRWCSVNISRYAHWTEHIYIATAQVAYAHAVHLAERGMGDFVLAPRY